MISFETKIRIIRDNLNRTGIGEKILYDAAVLALYSISQYDNFYPDPRISGNPPGSHSGG
jgi:hypothetical protein